MTSSKVSTKLKQKQQGLTIGKSENDETIRPSVISANSFGNKKKELKNCISYIVLLTVTLLFTVLF
jgi:hypothetical protein